MDKKLAAVSRIDDIGDVLRHVRHHALDNGAVRTSYHMTPAYESQVSSRTVVIQHGFSKEWMDLYERSDFRAHDPIPQRTMAHGASITWAEALAADALTAGMHAFADALKAHGLVHGFGIPLFGPKGRNAYSSFDFGKPAGEVEPGIVAFLTALSQASHQRICQLLERDRAMPSLSDRENEVLNLIAAGKSNTDIGTILNISPETVRTYSTRIYDKLGTRDRIGASIKALKLGLLAA